MAKVIIRNGLKFRSIQFKAEAKISAVREKENEIDVILTPSDGNSWEEKGWNLEHTIWGFERGDYTEVWPDTVNISIW